MLFVDVLLIAALAVFVGAWWLKPSSTRSRVLLAAALVALLSGLAGFMDDRWQAGAGVAVAFIMLLTLLVGRVRGRISHRVPVVSGIAFVLLAAVAVAPLVWFPVFPLTPPTGEHRVGVRTFELRDASRPGVFLAGAEEPRRLLVRAWYPASDVSNLRRRYYFSEREAQTTARDRGVALGFPKLFTYLKHVRTNSYEDAPLLAGAADLPVVFYSHGYTSFLGQHTALLEDLASHGYVVFSVQHTFDSTSTVFPNGEVAPVDPAMLEDIKRAYSEGPSPAQVRALTASKLDERLDGQLQNRMGAIARGDRTVASSAAVWLADRLFVHDQLQKGEVPKSIADLVAASDFASVGEMGMSFGGSTTGAICMVDQRCAAGVNLDGWDIHFTPFDAKMPAPFLMLHSDLGNFYRMTGAPSTGELRSYNEFSYEPIATAGENDHVYRLQIKGAQHSGFSDFSLFIRRPLRDSLFGTAPSRVLIGAQRALVRGFLDWHLRGAAGDFPQPQMAAYEGWISRVDNSSLRAWWAAKSDEERSSLQQRIEAVRAAATVTGAPHSVSSTASVTFQK